MIKSAILFVLLCVGSSGAISQTITTLYGVLDTSLGVVKKPTAKSSTLAVVNSSAQASSAWGIRGSEVLGAGLSARFNLQSDVQPDTGAGNLYMFRREAHVSVISATLGELRLGRTMSLAVANMQGGVVLPSNSIGTVLAQGLGVGADFFTKNAISWYSPNFMNTQAAIQYAMGEQSSGISHGRKISASLVHQTSALRAGVAAQTVNDRNGRLSRNWYNANFQYNLDAIKFGLGWYKVQRGRNAQAAVTETAGSTPNQVLDADTGMTIRSSAGYIASLGYQLAPQSVVAATYVHNDQDAGLLNVQMRHMLSKRTTAYVMFGRSFNDNGSGAGADAVKFSPYFQGVAGVAGVHQSVFAVGTIHTF